LEALNTKRIPGDHVVGEARRFWPWLRLRGNRMQAGGTRRAKSDANIEHSESGPPAARTGARNSLALDRAGDPRPLKSGDFPRSGVKAERGDASVPHVRSWFEAFQQKRNRAQMEGRVKRKRLSNAYHHLAFTMFSGAGRSDALVGGTDDPSVQWVCATCEQAIWMRVTRGRCPLCQRYQHKNCLTGSLLLLKPASLEPQPSAERRVAMRVAVCKDCEASVNSLRAFSSFRQSFGVQRKVVIFFNLFEKLKTNIVECLHSFGLFVMAFVENEQKASVTAHKVKALLWMAVVLSALAVSMLLCAQFNTPIVVLHLKVAPKELHVCFNSLMSCTQSFAFLIV
jgi:hypothetical protein